MDNSTRAIISGYIEKARKKLEVSERLLRSSDYDDAVSRAYYAAFHAAQALLLSEGERAETHKGVITLFGLLFVKSGKFDRRFGKYLANLKDERENGDYEVLSYIDQETAEKAVAEAGEFLREAETYLKKLGVID